MNQKTEIDDLKEEFKSLKDDIAALTAAVEDLAQSRKPSEDHVSFVDQLEEDFEKYREEGEALVHEVDSTIRTNPVRSVLIAVGVGYVLAKIMGQKQ